MSRGEQPDIEEKTYTLLRFQFLRGVEYSTIKFLATSLGGVNVYYPSCLNNDDWPSSLALDGEYSREQLEEILQRKDFEYKVVRGKSNTPYRLW